MMINRNAYLSVNMEEVINILLTLTADKNRRYDDKVYNPDLLLGIIDRALAYAVVEDTAEFDVKHFILSINYATRIYPFAKEIAINKLNNMHEYIYDNGNSIIDISDYKNNMF